LQKGNEFTAGMADSGFAVNGPVAIFSAHKESVDVSLTASAVKAVEKSNKITSRLPEMMSNKRFIRANRSWIDGLVAYDARSLKRRCVACKHICAVLHSTEPQTMLLDLCYHSIGSTIPDYCVGLTVRQSEISPWTYGTVYSAALAVPQPTPLIKILDRRMNSAEQKLCAFVGSLFVPMNNSLSRIVNGVVPLMDTSRQIQVFEVHKISLVEHSYILQRFLSKQHETSG